MNTTLFNLLLVLFLTSCFRQAEVTGVKNTPSPLSIVGMERANYNKSELTKLERVSEDSVSTTYDMHYTVNGTRQYGLISIPKSSKPLKGYPVILLIHGYVPHDRYSTVNSYRRIFNNYAKSEFIVIKPDLRGHGRSDFGENFDYSISRLLYTEDLLNLTYALKKQDNVDINNLFLMGHSNGGDTSLRLVTTKPNLYRGASLWAPVCVPLEKSNFFYTSGGRFIYGIEATNDPRAQNSISLEKKKLALSLKNVGINDQREVEYLDNLNRIKTPITIRHSKTDKIVPYTWSQELKDSFIESGNQTEFKLINYPNDDHNLSKHYNEVLKADLDWFRSLLQY